MTYNSSCTSSNTTFQEYKVSAGNKIAEISENGIVVGHLGAGKTTGTDAQSGAVSAVAAIAAGAAVMLL